MIHSNSMTASSVASIFYLTDTSRHNSDRGDLVILAKLVLGSVKKMKNEIPLMPTICSSVCTHMYIYIIIIIIMFYESSRHEPS